MAVFSSKIRASSVGRPKKALKAAMIPTFMIVLYGESGLMLLLHHLWAYFFFMLFFFATHTSFWAE